MAMMASMMKSIVNDISSDKEVHMDRIYKFEKMFLHVATKQKISPAMQQFIDDLIKLSDQGMKDRVMDKFATMTTQVDTGASEMTRCSDHLVGYLQDGLNKVEKLPKHQDAMESCVFKVLQDANLTDKAKNLTEVNWNYVSFQFSQLHLSVQVHLNPYISGDWAGEGKDMTCITPGTSSALTSMTCDKRADVCQDYTDTNAKKQFGICSGDRPKYTITNATPQCRDSGSCCDDPDANECDYKEGHYTTKGDHFKAMFAYWKSMIELWDKTKAECDQWTDWCCRNQTVCSIDPVPQDCNATQYQAPAPTTSDEPVVHECAALQDTLDREACDGTKSMIEGCSRYVQCYQDSNVSYSATWSSVCAPDAGLDQLRKEYYAILRLECVTTAAKTPDNPATPIHEMIPEVKKCKHRTRADYEPKLSKFVIESCTHGWPADMSKHNPHCKDVSDVSRFIHCPGTAAYNAVYYKNLPHPKECTASCCAVKPLSFGETTTTTTTTAAAAQTV
eukprot:TRINITY_DN3471_c1_g4_i1.p1 TRINITY_DN3471_c1_g4~~TRINITY_DN3471_c1_g4_i1.p1  ORF type:complete len:591 (+),score=131.27 TRINITY_DN3471_c1_g4_i1:262-1773(+)